MQPLIVYTLLTTTHNAKSNRRSLLTRTTSATRAALEQCSATTALVNSSAARLEVWRQVQMKTQLVLFCCFTLLNDPWNSAAQCQHSQTIVLPVFVAWRQIQIKTQLWLFLVTFMCFFFVVVSLYS